MTTATATIGSLAGAIDYFTATMAAHPARDGLAVAEAFVAGRRRRYAGLRLGHLGDPEDTFVPVDEMTLPAVEIADPDERWIAARIVGMLEPLKLLNPVMPAFGLGRGPGTLVTWFGIPLDAKAQDTPARTVTLAELLAQPPPDPDRDGLMPILRRDIERIKALTPPSFKINLPDMQGPYNIACSMLGQEAMTALYEEPDGFRELMRRITDLKLAVRRRLDEWIGPERLPPDCRGIARLAECSVNMISPKAYREHVLPHDRRIVEPYGAVHIHPCSGPHVFAVTLECLPGVVSSEAGYIAKTAAGAISVDDALALIGDRTIGLQIGQELPIGEEEAFIRADLDRYATHPRLTFNYTGMHWRKRDRPAIRAMHQRLDAYWDERYA